MTLRFAKVSKKSLLHPLLSFFLPVLAVGDVGELAGGAPAADDAVCGAGADGEGGGGVGVDLAVEFGRKGFEELLMLEGGAVRIGSGAAG